METVDIVVGIILLLGLLACLIKGAPEGYEDETGFHYGKPPTKKDE